MRRKFIDSVIGQVDKIYLQKVIDYGKVIIQRNSLLKYFFINRKFDKDTLDTYNQQLITLGTPIFKERNNFLKTFIPIFKNYYSEISSGNESVDITYKSDLNSGSFSEIKNFGSQGQQKSFLIALKLAQFDYYKTEFGNSPLVLLDDIFDKLDQERVRQIVQILENKDFGQIFITDTHIERVKDALSGLKNKEEIFDLKEIYSNG